MGRSSTHPSGPSQTSQITTFRTPPVTVSTEWNLWLGITLVAVAAAAAEGGRQGGEVMRAE
jgi:hypothetical protein